MHKFREIHPTRRSRRRCKNYQSYRKPLREDFKFKCWYCDTYDKIRVGFAIDHFVPRKPKDPSKFKNKVEDNIYENLVYSCAFCNGAKSNIWPTEDGLIHNDGKIWFVDPVSEEYSKLFHRTSWWSIVVSDYNPELASYIKETLKLWLPIHSIHWKMYRIIKLESHIRRLLDEKSNSSLQKIHRNIITQLGELKLQEINTYE